MISRKLQPFGTTIFSEMTQLAQRHGAINLAQGFPDFDGPSLIREAAVQAMKNGENQYSRSLGHPSLADAIARAYERFYGLGYDSAREVVIVNGATEGIAAALLGFLDPGDEAILFEPYYDSYHGCVAMAGGVPRFLTLEFPDFALDEERLRKLINERTKLLILNTPHNPSGKVFSRSELEMLARVCREKNVLVISDEVYEHLTFDGVGHVPIATLPGMRDLTLTISSSGKTFSFTGWKIGWAVGPPHLVAAVQAAHQFLTFCAPTPFQVGMSIGLRELGSDFYAELKAEYQVRRDVLLGVVKEMGLRASVPAGTYFILADISPVWDGDDRSFARHLIEECGVAALPPSPFYELQPNAGSHLIRFAFCKRLDTLQEAADRLQKFQA